jgi:hypothetical protein
MNDPKYSIMRKLIIAIGIIAAILAFLISFKAKGQIQMVARMLNLNIMISITPWLPQVGGKVLNKPNQLFRLLNVAAESSSRTRDSG